MRSVEPWHQTPWDWRAAAQFICGGTGAGLLLFTALAAWVDPAWLGRTGLAATGFFCLGLLSVWIKLGRRWRALFVFFNPRTSWMTREAMLAGPLIGLALIAVFFQSPPLATAAAAVGLGFLYAQARMLKEARGVPAWREPRMLPLIYFTGLAEGASLMMAATALFGSPGEWLPIALALLLVARLSLWMIYRRTLSAPGAAPVATVEVLDRAHANLVALHALPLVTLLLSWIVPGVDGAVALFAGISGLLGGWHLKFTLIARAAFNQGFALVRTPARSPGYAGPGVKPGWTTEERATHFQPSPLRYEGTSASHVGEVVPEG
jgi:phenylacetyl-CoA:acceptor oxidoreductase subunit 2